MKHQKIIREPAAGKEETEEQKMRRLIVAHHQAAQRHVAVFEAELSQEEKVQLFGLSNRIRKFGNALTGEMKKRLEQLQRTRQWRGAKKAYRKYPKKREALNEEMKQMMEDYGCTWEACESLIHDLRVKFDVPSVFALAAAEDVWSGVEKVLYGNGKRLHFQKKGEQPGIRAKQFDRAIVIKVCCNEMDSVHLQLGVQGMKFGVLIRDRYEQDEMRKIVHWLLNSDLIEERAALKYAYAEEWTDTGRPCYATLVCKTIRGRLRVYVHITVEGLPEKKRRTDGSLRHPMGTGTVGCDIGTQSVAWNADAETGLCNLGERGQYCETAVQQRKSPEQTEGQIARLQEKYNRSLRAMNPQNYNPNGTIKRGRKTWGVSKNGRKLKRKIADLCRKAAVTRRLAANEAANHMRSLGDRFVTEPKNASKLAKRAKETTYREDGTPNRKKRFGHSIQMRCPGEFQQTLKQKFERTGGTYEEVPYSYRASQYDHTADAFIKKELDDRMYALSDGTEVQRDCYSAFLLSCAAPCSPPEIDKDKCGKNFPSFCARERQVVNDIRSNGKDVKNSGIKPMKQAAAAARPLKAKAPPGPKRHSRAAYFSLIKRKTERLEQAKRKAQI